MDGKWTTVTSYTETVEDSNPAVWYEAAKNATTYESAMRYYEKAESYYKNDQSGYVKDWFVKEKLYFKFHKRKVYFIVCVALAIVIGLIYTLEQNEMREKRARLEEAHQRREEYQRIKEQQRIREREIQQRIRERQEKARIQAEKEAAEKEARENANKPERIFMSFHQAITDGRLRDDAFPRHGVPGHGVGQGRGRSDPPGGDGDDREELITCSLSIHPCRRRYP